MAHNINSVCPTSMNIQSIERHRLFRDFGAELQCSALNLENQLYPAHVSPVRVSKDTFFGIVYDDEMKGKEILIVLDCQLMKALELD